MTPNPFNFSKEDCERIYLIDRWPRKKFEEAYPNISWQAFLYYVRKKHRLPLRVKYTTNNDLILSKLTYQEKDIIVGSLLGDATLIKNKWESTYFRIAHSIKQQEYLEWKKELLSRIILGKIIPQTHKFGKTVLYIANALHELRQWEEDWYIKISENKRRKIVPIEYLDYMTELGLCIWYLDDGHYAKKSSAISIATYAFTIEELDTLRVYLKNRFDLDCRKGNDNQLYFNRENTKKLIKLIEKFVIPSMQYKLGINNVSAETTCGTPEMDEDIVRTI